MADEQQPPNSPEELDIDLANQAPIPADYTDLTELLGLEEQPYVPGSQRALTPATQQEPDINLANQGIPTRYSDLVKSLFEEQPYNAKKKHDEVRARISYILLIFLGGALFLSFAVLITTFFLPTQATAWGDAKDLLQVLIPTLTTLIGSIVGFYFGSHLQDEHTS